MLWLLMLAYFFWRLAQFDQIDNAGNVVYQGKSWQRMENEDE